MWNDLGQVPILFAFQGKYVEKYFKKFHSPKFRFQLLDGHFIDLLA